MRSPSKINNKPLSLIQEINSQEVEVLNSPINLSGEDILPNFTLDLTEIF